MASTGNLSYVEYETSGGVGVWSISDFAAYFESDEVGQGEEHYRQEAGADSMDGTVVIIENAESLGSDMRDSLDHIGKEWSQLADDVDIDRLAYVADGIMSTTVKMKIEADVDVESFDSADEAIEWCQQA